MSDLTRGQMAGVIRKATESTDEDLGRSLHVADQWHARGMSYEQIANAVRSMREMIDAGRFNDWIPPGSPFTLRAMNGTRQLVDHHSGERIVRKVLDMALEYVPPTPRKYVHRDDYEPKRMDFTAFLEAS